MCRSSARVVCFEPYELGCALILGPQVNYDQVEAAFRGVELDSTYPVAHIRRIVEEHGLGEFVSLYNLKVD